MWKYCFSLFFILHFSTVAVGQVDPLSQLLSKPLPNAYGQLIDPTDGVDKALVIIFLNHDCQYAKLYVDRLNQLEQYYSSQGVKMIAIESNIASLENTASSLASFIRERSISFSYLIDLDNQLTSAMNAESSPQAFLLQKEEDKYQLLYDGSIDNNSRKPERATKHYLRDAMDQMLNNNKIERPRTKPIGCDLTAD